MENEIRLLSLSFLSTFLYLGIYRMLSGCEYYDIVMCSLLFSMYGRNVEDVTLGEKLYICGEDLWLSSMKHQAFCLYKVRWTFRTSMYMYKHMMVKWWLIFYSDVRSYKKLQWDDIGKCQKKFKWNFCNTYMKLLENGLMIQGWENFKEENLNYELHCKIYILKR